GDRIRGDGVEDVRWSDGLRGGLQEAAERRRQVERDRALVDDLRGDVPPRLAARTRVGGAAQDVDGERDVVRGDRLAVLPMLVGAEVEGPRAPGLVDIPARG